MGGEILPSFFGGLFHKLIKGSGHEPTVIMKEDQGFERCSAAQVAVVGMFRPQKSNIDTNTTLAIFEGVSFETHHLGYPAVSFRECRSFFILISNGLK